MDLSNSAINKVGDIVRQGSTAHNYEQAVKTLNSWRELHGPLLDEYYDKCVKVAEDIGDNIIIAQRLKRLPTIIGKLNRFKKMRLSSMQDIAGLRIVVDDMQQLKLVENKIRKWKYLVKIRDYIEKPKQSGYRCKHFTFKKDGMLVEIQLRTSLQHLWATTVETTDVFRGASLKEKDDKSCWHDFFCQVSSIFAIVEETRPVLDHQNLGIEKVCELLKTNMKTNRIDSLIASYALTEVVVTNEKMKNAYYAVLKLDFRKKEATITGYRESEYHLAFEEYQKQEQENDVRNRQSVLIAVNQIRKIQEAYPNYFMNLNTFMSIISFILAKNEKKA